MQSRHQHCIRSTRNISLQGESCRDKIMLSRQHLYWEVVATRLCCRDNICAEKTSRQQLHREDVATRSGCRDNNCTSNLSQPHKATTRPATSPATRTATRLATTSAYWASLLKSNKKCLEIRAQLQNPINM